MLVSRLGVHGFQGMGMGYAMLCWVRSQQSRVAVKTGLVCFVNIDFFS